MRGRGSLHCFPTDRKRSLPSLVWLRRAPPTPGVRRQRRRPGSVPDVKRVESAARRLLALVDQVPEGAEAPEWSPSPSSAPSATTTTATTTPAAAAESATLLVVDDDENNRDILGRVLQSKGYGVVLAGTGPEALELVEKQPIDLVLLDIMMPDVSGLEVLAALRASHPR